MTNFNRIFANGRTIGGNLRALRVLAFAIIASITLVACSDSDSDEPPENEGLIGIWEVDGDNRDDYYLEISEQLSSNIVQIEFRASTFLVSADCFTYDFTFWTQDPSNPDLWANQDNAEIVSLTRDGSKLVIHDSASEKIADAKAVTSTTMFDDLEETTPTGNPCTGNEGGVQIDTSWWLG